MAASPWRASDGMDSAQLGAGAAAAIIATLGLWWFRMILKDVRTLPPATRFGIYALIWLAYFVAVMLLIARG